MNDKNLAIEEILNKLGMTLPLDREVVKVKLGEVLSNYLIERKYIENSSKDLIEKIELYFECQSIYKTINKNSEYQYRLKLMKFAEYTNKSVDTISTQDIRDFLSKIKTNNITNDTLTTYIVTLRSFFNFLVEEEIILKNPMIRIRTPKSDKKIRVALEDEELEILRNACETNREKCLVEFLFSTACRVSEASNIKVADINFKNKSIIINGKGDKERVVYFSSKCKLLIEKLLDNQKYDSEYLLTNTKLPHNSLSTESLEKEIRKIAGRTNIKKQITPHILRHTWATLALKSNVPLDIIQSTLGHDRITTTQIYITQDLSRKEYECKKFLG